MHLFQLAPELLIMIFEQIGPAHMRSSVSYLLVSRAWYRVAHPVYLSGLELSTLYLSSRDLERLPPHQAPLSKLIHSNTKRLSLRLVGHPSKQIAKSPWHVEQSSNDDESDDVNPDELREDWATNVPMITDDIRSMYDWTVEERRLLAWRKRVNNKLTELAGWLPAIEGLEELSFEASSEHEGIVGPRWDYLTGGSVASLIYSLPSGLRNLTFDTSGSTITTSKDDRTPAHLCPLIARRIHDFQHVRLRMRHICPEIFKTTLTACTTASKLQSLVIRLSLPFFPPATYEKHDGSTEFDAQPCKSDEAPLYEAMIDAGTIFVRENPSLKVLRISFREPESINLVVADCVERRFRYDPSEVFSYEDDGREWGAWEENGLSRGRSL
ncbi:hypothetical protein JMJ35_006815 [Cladonia borealis]|uniref:F-box domain-containing protein n=1 Tax=Cladonia borealis TaxID=184061 RepID=A0AA39QZ53_9LECA|nr:hypothetical protein JMJ35_006815 [Cladonia borealis]